MICQSFYQQVQKLEKLTIASRKEIQLTTNKNRSLSDLLEIEYNLNVILEEFNTLFTVEGYQWVHVRGVGKEAIELWAASVAQAIRIYLRREGWDEDRIQKVFKTHYVVTDFSGRIHSWKSLPKKPLYRRQAIAVYKKS